MKSKIFLTISLFWIVLVGYLVWVNGIVSKGDKSFRWDEWIWFGFENKSFLFCKPSKYGIHLKSGRVFPEKINTRQSQN